jgi:hypothetical protein
MNLPGPRAPAVQESLMLQRDKDPRTILSATRRLPAARRRAGIAVLTGVLAATALAGPGAAPVLAATTFPEVRTFTGGGKVVFPGTGVSTGQVLIREFAPLPPGNYLASLVVTFTHDVGNDPQVFVAPRVACTLPGGRERDLAQPFNAVANAFSRVQPRLFVSSDEPTVCKATFKGNRVGKRKTDGNPQTWSWSATLTIQGSLPSGTEFTQAVNDFGLAKGQKHDIAPATLTSSSPASLPAVVRVRGNVAVTSCAFHDNGSASEVCDALDATGRLDASGEPLGVVVKTYLRLDVIEKSGTVCRQMILNETGNQGMIDREITPQRHHEGRTADADITVETEGCTAPISLQAKIMVVNHDTTIPIVAQKDNSQVILIPLS